MVWKQCSDRAASDPWLSSNIGRNIGKLYSGIIQNDSEFGHRIVAALTALCQERVQQYSEAEHHRPV
jgi:hypothetical protein